MTGESKLLSSYLIPVFFFIILFLYFVIARVSRAAKGILSSDESKPKVNRASILLAWIRSKLPSEKEKEKETFMLNEIDGGESNGFDGFGVHGVGQDNEQLQSTWRPGHRPPAKIHIMNLIQLQPGFGVAVWSLALTAYSNITKTTLSLLNCQTVPGLADPVMVSAGRYTCYTQWFHVLAFILLLAVLFFPISLVLYAGSQRSKQKKLPNQTVFDGRSSVGAFLTICYRSEFWYWESILMLRRLVLILVDTFVHDVVWKALILAGGCLLFLLSNYIFRPFATRLTHNVENTVLSLLVLVSMLNIQSAERMRLGVSETMKVGPTVIHIVAVSIVLCIGIVYIFGSISESKLWKVTIGRVWNYTFKKESRDKIFATRSLIAFYSLSDWLDYFYSLSDQLSNRHFNTVM